MIKVCIGILGCKGWGRSVCAYVGVGEGDMWVHMWGEGRRRGNGQLHFAFAFCF